MAVQTIPLWAEGDGEFASERAQEFDAMPDQPENPRDYDMRIPPPTQDEKTQNQHRGKNVVPGGENRSGNEAEDANQVHGNLRPEIGEHLER